MASTNNFLFDLDDILCGDNYENSCQDIVNQDIKNQNQDINNQDIIDDDEEASKKFHYKGDYYEISSNLNAEQRQKLIQLLDDDTIYANFGKSLDDCEDICLRIIGYSMREIPSFEVRGHNCNFKNYLTLEDMHIYECELLSEKHIQKYDTDRVLLVFESYNSSGSDWSIVRKATYKVYVSEGISIMNMRNSDKYPNHCITIKDDILKWHKHIDLIDDEDYDDDDDEDDEDDDEDDEDDDDDEDAFSCPFFVFSVDGGYPYYNGGYFSHKTNCFNVINNTKAAKK